MDELPIVAGPPRAELHPVKQFMPGINLDDDERYLALSGPLPPEEIEFAKAMAMCKGNASRAAAMIFPDMTEVNQRKWGSRHAKAPAVVALINYLQSLDYTDDRPVTLEELRKEINKRWRGGVKDSGAYMELTKMMMQLNGIKVGDSNGPKGDEQLEIAMQRADEILKSFSAPAVLQ